MCVGCQRRGTVCIGQEFVDHSASADQDFGERLKRVEKMLEMVTEKLCVQSLEGPPVSSAAQAGPHASSEGSIRDHGILEGEQYVARTGNVDIDNVGWSHLVA